ncbi:MAG: GNAT family N-acetyltransferase [Saprospiraceae bacterium]
MLVTNFNPFPVLETERLLLRRITPDDADDLFILRADENIMRFIPRPLANTREDVLELIQTFDAGINHNELINWAITFREINRLIGTIGFIRMQKENYRAEVGYMLHFDYQRKGVMQEALAVVIKFGFQAMQLHSIEAVIDPENIASAKLLERNHFIKEGHFKENCYFNDKFRDSVHYSLLTPLS